MNIFKKKGIWKQEFFFYQIHVQKKRYSVTPIYHARVYGGIGYIAVACWTPYFCATISRILQTYATKSVVFFVKIGLDLFNDDTRPSGHISRPIFRKIVVTPWTPFVGNNFALYLSQFFIKDHYIRCLHAQFVAKHPYCRSYRAEIRNMILAHGSRLIPVYRAPTYILVAFLGSPPTARVGESTDHTSACTGKSVLE